MNSCLDELLEEYRRRTEAWCSDAPPDLKLELVPTLAPNPIGRVEVKELEALVPFRLPESLVSYLTGPVVESGLEWAEIILPSNASTEEIGRLLRDDSLWPVGLLQFAYGPWGDPVWFDVGETARDGEYPVVVINHDWAIPGDFEDPGRIRAHCSVRWGSFMEFLTDVCNGADIQFSNPA